MNDPIRPREKGGIYACWLRGMQRESEAGTYEYLHWRATPRHAALSFAEDLADHGKHPEFVGTMFEVLVRDKVDGSLTSVSIDWEPEPMPFVSGMHEIERGVGAAHG